jgi:hypothetical protein
VRGVSRLFEMAGRDLAALDESQKPQSARGKVGASQSICARSYKDPHVLETRLIVVSLRLLEAGAAYFCRLRLTVAAWQRNCLYGFPPSRG